MAIGYIKVKNYTFIPCKKMLVGTTVDNRLIDNNIIYRGRNIDLKVYIIRRYKVYDLWVGITQNSKSCASA